MPDDGIAGVVLDSAAMKRAVDHLTDVAMPMGIRLAVAGDVVSFTFHDAEVGWWATTRCRGTALPDSPPDSTVATTVPRLVFREALELTQLDPSGQCAVVVHHEESVHIGGTAIAASESWPIIPEPPSVGSLLCVEPALALPIGTPDEDGEVSFVAGGVPLTVAGELLERFEHRDVGHVGVYRYDESALLFGETREVDPDDRLLLIVVAHHER